VVEHLDLAPDLDLLDAELMWQSLLDRVEHRNGAQRVPLPAAIGECVFVNDIARAEIEASILTLH
jgi:3-dehydroquinate synthase